MKQDSNLMELIMVDEISNPEAAPAVTVDSPSVEVAPSPAVVETPAVETSNVEIPVTPEVVVPEAPAAETLLGAEKKPQETIAEEKPEGETEEKAQPEKETPTEEVALPEYEPFVLPDGAEVEADKMGEFTKTLAEFENTTKASHEEVQKLGQQLVDRHIAELNRYTESLTHAWNKQKNDWKDSFLKDPEFANRTDTVVNSALDAIAVYAGDSKQQDEFRGLMESTGIGNHPAMIRLLSNIMLAKAEPKPLAAPQIAATIKGTKIERMYGKKK